ncbi:FG-GAP repeat domain-containing protein [Prosthecobacter sp.]|uniref:FG-GAP repeat domain-containing protein n=1 Tax=Prosthecobacter sp. TaxID=1965333 RepID=UPI003784B31C
MRPIFTLCLFCYAASLKADEAVILAPGAPWKRHTIDKSSRGADGVKLGDWNKDGLQDIVTGWEEGGVVKIYVNPGAAKAREPWEQITVGEVKNVEEAFFADLDGDGELEVVSGTEGKTCTLYWHRQVNGKWTTQAFPEATGNQMWMQAAAVDLDGQFGPDLLVASKNKGAAVSWMQAPQKADDLQAWTLHKLRDSGWVMSVTPQDMDGDGDADAVISDRKGERTGVFWLENPGASANREHAAWREHAVGGLGKQVMFADLGDVNGDGLLDVAVAAKPVEIVLCLRKADGGWQERVVKLDGTNLGDAKAVKIADVNGDKLPDLLFTCENAKGQLEGIVWLEQQREGAWKQHTLGGPEGLKYDLMQTLDLDGDGDLDVITCEERDQLGVFWYENPRL